MSAMRQKTSRWPGEPMCEQLACSDHFPRRHGCVQPGRKSSYRPFATFRDTFPRKRDGATGGLVATTNRFWLPLGVFEPVAANHPGPLAGAGSADWEFGLKSVE